MRITTSSNGGAKAFGPEYIIYRKRDEKDNLSCLDYIFLAIWVLSPIAGKFGILARMGLLYWGIPSAGCDTDLRGRQGITAEEPNHKL